MRRRRPARPATTPITAPETLRASATGVAHTHTAACVEVDESDGAALAVALAELDARAVDARLAVEDALGEFDRPDTVIAGAV